MTIKGSENCFPWSIPCEKCGRSFTIMAETEAEAREKFRAHHVHKKRSP